MHRCGQGKPAIEVTNSAEVVDGKVIVDQSFMLVPFDFYAMDHAVVIDYDSDKPPKGKSWHDMR